jgi:hypothetical protein
MRINFKDRYLLILAVTAGICSRIILALFNDPEGPNLLVVTMMAAVIYLLSAPVYLSNVYPSLTGLKRSSATIFIQIFVATAFYFGLR